MDADIYHKLYETIVDKLYNWAQGFAALLPNFVVAVLVIIVFWLLARLMGNLTGRALRRTKADQAAVALLDTFVRLLVVGLGITVALGVLNLDKAMASLLAGAGIVGLALGFAFQDLAANLISGVGLAVKRTHPFKIGDLIETNDFMGTVRHVHLRTSTLETLDGKTVILPNKQIYQAPLVNYSAAGRRRVDLEVGVSYGEDLERVRQITEQALIELPGRRSEPPRVYFDGFGDSSINFLCWHWIDFSVQEDYLRARNEAVLAIKRAYNEHDITIPFPIRTLDFGIKGGERLAEVLDERPAPGRTALAGAAPKQRS